MSHFSVRIKLQGRTQQVLLCEPLVNSLDFLVDCFQSRQSEAPLLLDGCLNDLSRKPGGSGVKSLSQSGS
jgi:hypothetical protein